jgi:hypothetical protein
MYILLVCFSLLSVITHATAQFNSAHPPIEYVAPPLETGILAVTAFFTLTTLIQLIIVLTYLSRGRAPHILPAIFALSGILFTLVSYVIYILEFLTSFDFFNPLLPTKLLPRFDTGESHFIQWILCIYQLAALAIFKDFADPLIFMAVALIIRDRYRTYTQKAESEQNSATLPSIELFMIPFYVLAALTVIFSSAEIGVFETLVQTIDSHAIVSVATLDAQTKIAGTLQYTSEAMYGLATVLLVPFAILVKSRIKSRDTVTVLFL